MPSGEAERIERVEIGADPPVAFLRGSEIELEDDWSPKRWLALAIVALGGRSSSRRAKSRDLGTSGGKIAIYGFRGTSGHVV
ncbi:MAG: hypothetical protein HYV07_14710 [Deltaproteobacteria bacterium]|nr:hypothetical protein [Deltaproteobacteria bacterium]